MSRISDGELTPRNGHTLMAGFAARISGCANQKEESLEDQTDHNKEVVSELYGGKIQYLIVATKGKGELLLRPELAQIEAEFRKAYLDIFIIEDLGRLVRGVEAVRLLGIAVDRGTRVIAPNDNIDTANPTWEADAIKACADHVAHNAHTSRRLKHKLRNRFLKFGGAMARPIAGYVVSEDAETYGDWRKDSQSDPRQNPDANPWIYDGLDKLRETKNYSAVADMFTARNIPTGPYVRSKRWTGRLVRDFYNNPLLKGMARRNEMHSIKFHETGRRASVKNPDGPVFYACPHLAYFQPDEIDPVLADLKRINAKKGRKPKDGVDPRQGVPRKRTVFPAQHARCWYCGFTFVRGGNGQPEFLMCSNSRHRGCWNSMAFNGRIAAKRIVEAISRELYALPEFDQQFVELVRLAHGQRSGAQDARLQKLRSDEANLDREIENFKIMIAKCGPSELLVSHHDELQQIQKSLKFERQNLGRIEHRELILPGSIVELRQMLECKFQELAIESAEFGDLMRRLVPEFYVYLVRLIDGGHPHPRAKVKLDLGAIVPDIQHAPGLSTLLTRELTLDLFDPPQRAVIREEAVRLAGMGLHQREIGRRIDGEPPQAVVQKALALHRRMKELGLDCPFVMLHEPPPDYPKLRKHQHPGYSFCCLDGYERRQL